MPSADHDMCLMMAVHDGCVRRATAALAAGANVNGRPGEKSAPIVLATAVDRPAMILFLVRHGADPDGRIFEPLQHPHPTEDMSVGMPGERALHIAAKSGNVELVRLLLKQARADPNAGDNEGCTPLNATCQCQHACVEAVVRLLLEAGADPTLARKDGYGPMHGVAVRGHEGLVDVLLSRQPSTLNHCSPDGASPLFVACGEGRERMVSLLLSRGATQWMLGDEKHMFPLLAAVHEGHMGVVRILTNEGGTRAVGGELALTAALYRAIRARRGRILRFLLALEGEEMRSKWANTNLDLDGPLLHHGTGHLFPAAVSILLEAGADEAVRDFMGRLAIDAIGVWLEMDDVSVFPSVPVARRKEGEVAIRRMLERSPAYRARSWAWPSRFDDEKDDARAGGRGGDDTAPPPAAATPTAATATAAAAAAAAAAATAALSCPPAVRIYRPKDIKSRRKLFARNIGRYCAKK